MGARLVPTDILDGTGLGHILHGITDSLMERLRPVKRISMLNKLILYVKNLAIASARMVKAPLGLYKYSSGDGYVKNVLVVLDCLGNTLLGGDPDETISSRSGKAQAYELSQGRWGWGCRLCSFLAAFQKDHCAIAVNRNKGRRAVIPDEGE